MRQSMCGKPYRPPCHASMRQSMCCVCVCVCVCVAGCQLSGLSVDRSVGLSPDSSVGVRLCVQLRAHECVRACAHISPQMRSVRCMRAGAYRRLHPHVCGHVRMCVFVCSPPCLRTCACIMCFCCFRDARRRGTTIAEAILGNDRPRIELRDLLGLPFGRCLPALRPGACPQRSGRHRFLVAVFQRRVLPLRGPQVWLQIQGALWLRWCRDGAILDCRPVAHMGTRPMGGQPVSVQEYLFDGREPELARRLREHSCVVLWENVSADKVGLVVLPPHACGLQMDLAPPTQTPAVAARGVLARAQQTMQDMLLPHRSKGNELPATF
jgi:hypothetical protein